MKLKEYIYIILQVQFKDKCIKQMTLKEAIVYIQSDFTRYGKNPSLKNILFSLLFKRNFCFAYSFWLRMAKVKGVFSLISRYMHWRLSRKYGIQIPIKTKIGYGFYIGHGVGIIVNENAEIGDNCNISQFTTIGAHGKAATIGNNVYIGPSVCIVNDVNIGNLVSIGAGAVVTKDIPDYATAAGVPAKILNFENPGRYVNNRFPKDL